jgi:hypothetical protein
MHVNTIFFSRNKLAVLEMICTEKVKAEEDHTVVDLRTEINAKERLKMNKGSIILFTSVGLYDIFIILT